VNYDLRVPHPDGDTGWSNMSSKFLMHGCLLVKPRLCRVQTKPNTNQCEVTLTSSGTRRKKRTSQSTGVYFKLGVRDLVWHSSPEPETHRRKMECEHVSLVTAIFKKRCTGPMSRNSLLGVCNDCFNNPCCPLSSPRQNGTRQGVRKPGVGGTSGGKTGILLFSQLPPQFLEGH
jgi:hypothetical protein